MTTTRTPVGDLSDLLTGIVLDAAHPDYATAGSAWNLAFTHRPDLVVVAADERDVAATVNHARGAGLSVTVQATGHGVTVPADSGSILLVMSRLNRVVIDPESRTATVGGGARMAAVLAAAQEHGLAPALGSSPSVGAVGYSMGGGFGWLARQYGLGVDAVRQLRVATADGAIVTASPESNPDLFWAMCGSGGSSFGVVVEMTMALFPVTQVYAGSLLYPFEAAADVYDRYRELDVPEEFTDAFNITSFPPLDMVPEPIRGKTFAIVRGCHTDLDGGRAIIDGWRQWREPLMDMFGPMPFTQAAAISQDPEDPVPGATTGRWLTGLSDEVGRAMIDAMTPGEFPSPVLLSELRRAGGAVSRPNPSVSYESRDASHALEMVGMVMGPESAAALAGLYSATWGRLADDLTTLPAYLNFAEGPERRALAQGAFSAGTLSRLAEIKAQVDPTGVFRHGVI